MTRELLILRHGKSDWDAGTNDYHRPLTTRGVKGAQRIGNWLAQEDLVPDLTISSTATRAMSTAEFALNCMGKGAQDILQDKTLYLANVDELLTALSGCPDSPERVMIVGHNPGLEDLLEYLVTDAPVFEDGKMLPTSTIARLRMPDDWHHLAKGCATLVSHIRPTMLPEKFPYPDVDSKKFRNKPAYYYQQASALPYRVTEEGKIEFLIIRSRKLKKWIIPKGIQSPGQSATETAAIEAREEAGVEGDITETPIMTYQYKKWGGLCTVQVFPLRVTNILPEDEWEERYRGRKWVKAKIASKRISQNNLKPVFSMLAEKIQS